MGFLSKAFKRVKKQIIDRQPSIGSIRTPDNFVAPTPIIDYLPGRRPQRGGFFGGFGNLGEAIRRLKEQGDMGMLKKRRMPRIDDGRMRAMPIGPGDRLQMPQPIPRAEIDISALEPLPMGDMPMTQDLPEVAPVGMMAGRTLQQDFPTQPRMMMAEGDEVFMDSSPEQQAFSIETEIKNLMNEYEMAVRNNEMDRAEILGQEINRMEAYKIQMMANALEKSDEEFERDLYRDTLLSYPFYDRGMEGNRRGLDKYGNPLNIMEDRPYQVKSEQSTLKHFIDKEGKGALDTFRKYRRPEFDRRPQLAEGGEPFPDLSGDGKITRKDILIGQGVKFKAEGGEMMMEGNEIDAMLSGMGSEEAGAMEDLEQMAPEMEMIDQLVMMVVQMIQQGASEEEVMMFLREQGLDDEDIGTVLQLVAEMAEAEAMPQDGIGAELEQLA